MEVTPDFLKEQLDAVFTDIRPDAVKTGMVSSPALIRTIADRLHFYAAENIVVDPVMVSTSGNALTTGDIAQALKKELFPAASLITPNIPEGEVLTGIRIYDAASMETAARILYEEYGCGVLLKGGHRMRDANDLLYTKDGAVWLYGNRINNPNTHGTGCTLSSAIASNLAMGSALPDAVSAAKRYISLALQEQLDLGEGPGPMDHMFVLKDQVY